VDLHERSNCISQPKTESELDKNCLLSSDVEWSYCEKFACNVPFGRSHPSVNLTKIAAIVKRLPAAPMYSSNYVITDLK